MSGAYSRNKGKRAELELCGLLREYLGVEATRNYKQFAQAQHGDIEQLVGPYLVEIKNHKDLAIGAWWQQAVAAAQVHGMCQPCVAYRLPNRGLYDRWRFVVPDQLTEHEWGLDYRYAAELQLDGFAARVREHL
jgi:hypothetical protein